MLLIAVVYLIFNFFVGHKYNTHESRKFTLTCVLDISSRAEILKESDIESFGPFLCNLSSWQDGGLGPSILKFKAVYSVFSDIIRALERVVLDIRQIPMVTGSSPRLFQTSGPNA